LCRFLPETTVCKGRFAVFWGIGAIFFKKKADFFANLEMNFSQLASCFMILTRLI
jgi:hypothetical protein